MPATTLTRAGQTQTMPIPTGAPREWPHMSWRARQRWIDRQRRTLAVKAAAARPAPEPIPSRSSSRSKASPTA